MHYLCCSNSVHIHLSDNNRGSGGSDPYLHLHKEQLARSALLFGAGILKGAVLTTLLNNANGNNNNGLVIGKK